MNCDWIRNGSGNLKIRLQLNKMRFVFVYLHFGAAFYPLDRCWPRSQLRNLTGTDADQNAIAFAYLLVVVSMT